MNIEKFQKFDFVEVKSFLMQRMIKDNKECLAIAFFADEESTQLLNSFSIDSEHLETLFFGFQKFIKAHPDFLRSNTFIPSEFPK